jgi:hypothetical protein
MPNFETCKLSVILNFEHINSGTPLPTDVLREADVFVFQPLHVRHGAFSADSVLRTLPSDCIPISFPYIFNSGFWPLVPHGGRILGAKEFVKKLPFAASLRRAESEIGSRVAVDLAIGRYVSDLKRLKDTESTTTVQISNFVEEHVSSRRLFWTENHPVEEVMVEVGRQVIASMGLEALDYSGPVANCEPYPIGAHMGRIPIHPQVMYEGFGALWQTTEDCCGWQSFYRGLAESVWRGFTIRGRVFRRIQDMLQPFQKRE